MRLCVCASPSNSTGSGGLLDRRAAVSDHGCQVRRLDQVLNRGLLERPEPDLNPAVSAHRADRYEGAGAGESERRGQIGRRESEEKGLAGYRGEPAFRNQERLVPELLLRYHTRKLTEGLGGLRGGGDWHDWLQQRTPMLPPGSPRREGASAIGSEAGVR